ncbi:molybdate ABC transporter substrate-binding protein [Paracoccus aminophilus]|uniref:Molybdenum ABC transporter n=1 Tax=Paracoccus aminophilus JCM 7686 TaxID=1367847 RepID=S5XJR0_PARAH|nr:molybdate ABC transporter substrate-binding protein [Paracoccus aminophilus]AGT07424.1 molybdenum ABC transporter [Paracoccus aminophilus JCM 7686]
MRFSLITAAFCALVATPALAEDFTIFAAASLKDALDKVAEDWKAQTGDTVTISYAGSSQLAKQIQQGAPADIFISAAVNWMDALEKSDNIDKSTRTDLLGNTLVIVGKDAPALTELDKLPEALNGGKLAMALIDSVPAGQYGKQALEKLNLWSKVEGQVAQADNVRAALALVATGEAPLGIVYGSDAVAEKDVKVVATFPEDSHDAIVYPAALIKGTKSAEAGKFLSSLKTDPAKKVFEDFGFTVLP